ncbi:MAG TPA: ATP-binding protein [Acidobacteriota bacterium]|nr:ATP-binding protein [Acidobacteriota bacterium]
MDLREIYMSKRRYLGLQAKVLIPVLTLLVLVLALATLLISRRVTDQLRMEAQRSLTTTEAVFHNSLEIRARNLVLRYQNIVNEPRFKAVATLGEAKTMQAQLKELMGELGPEVEAILFTTAEGSLLAGALRDYSRSMLDFKRDSEASIRQALQGTADSATIATDKYLLNVVSTPVTVSDTLLGVLTIHVRIDETAARELKSLTHSEIVFISESHVLASTLKDSAWYRSLIQLFGELVSNEVNSAGNRTGEWIAPGGEHFICRAGFFNDKTNERLGYILLASFQQPLQVMQQTKRTLWLLAVTTILISSILIAALIRKITHPLRQLRDSAEAVGRGDFSRRVEQISNDECGELALVFNQMTEKLTASRAQMEQVLQSLRNTRAQLIQSEKLSAIGEFVSGIAHELNNPLTAVIGFSEMLQESGISDRQRKFVDRIKESADRCHKIVHNLLSFARQHPPERKWVVINVLIEAAIDILHYELRTSNIAVVKNLSPDIPRILVDPHQMQQVFLNIMNNARHAIENHQDSGEIRISTTRTGMCVRISFQDNGPGILPEHLSRIFDPFFTTKPVGIGTGLGLSLSYGIIQEHRGTISAHSVPCEGASFVIELPVTQPAQESIGESFSDQSFVSAKDGSGKKILVIDDEEAILELLSETLTPRGYQVDTVRDGISAVRQFQQARYDLIVCDWKIPGLSGQQIFEKICEIEPQAPRRFIFITGDLLNQKSEQFLRDQQTPCLSKPFSSDELIAAIRKILEAQPSVSR